MPLLTTKLYIPPVRPRLVSRPGLIERLSGGMDRRLTLISAPAGFGKTTLLSEWAPRCGRPVAWLSLDESDNDPSRFLTYLIAALQGIDAGIGQGALGAPHAPQALPVTSLLLGLINELAAVPAPFVMILDDYHLIEAQLIHQALTFLLDHQPPQMHLVLATRADPPLPLARLRARDQLAELRQGDLRFTTDEAATFLNDIMGLGLSPEDVAALEARTEGWSAGLQMASLSLQGRGQDPATRSELVQAFTGSHRFVLDYLVSEVLEQQPPFIQEFLLKTSILEHLTGPLCDALITSQSAEELATTGVPAAPGRSDSQSILEQLEAANLFIVPLDDERSWYRYHRLFSDLLRKRLWRTSPDLVPTLHRRASEWHAQQGLMAGAIDHALAAHDFERAAQLIEQGVEATLMRSEVTTLLNWVQKLPDEWVRGHPTLCFYHAWALLMTGRSPEVIEQRLHDLARAEESPESAGLMAGRMAALRAYYRLFQCDVERAAELSRQALEYLPASDRFLRSIVTWILSLARLGRGELEDGREALEGLAAAAQESGNPLVAVAALCYEARQQKRRGRLHRARDILDRALQLATDPRGKHLPIASKALMGLGELECEWNDLQAAAAHLCESIELARQWTELAAFDACFPLARVRWAQGDVHAAREALETGRQIAYKSEVTDLDDRVADFHQALFLIFQGDVEGATRWAERRGLVPGGCAQASPGPGHDLVDAHLRKYEDLVLARLFLLQGRAAAALELLEALSAQVRQLGRIDLVIEIHILKALACQEESNDAQAMADLAEALSLAEPGGYVRIFLDEGEPMARLLCQAASRGIASEYVAKLLADLGGSEPRAKGDRPVSPQVRPLLEPLSERELEVLRLLATGLSNPEIAGELIVAVSTVHAHCKSIYGKLAVHRRWDAVQRARELGLIQ